MFCYPFFGVTRHQSRTEMKGVLTVAFLISGLWCCTSVFAQDQGDAVALFEQYNQFVMPSYRFSNHDVRTPK